MGIVAMLVAGGAIIGIARMEDADGMWINQYVVTITLYGGVAGALWWLTQKIGSTFYLF